MQPIRLVSAAGQVAAYLREAAVRGQLGDKMPGVGCLAAKLGVNHKTVEAALRQLETEGLLEGQGAGHKRRIMLTDGKPEHSLRVAILDYEPLALTEGYVVTLQHMLTEAGHAAFFSDRCLLDLGMKIPRIRRLVDKTRADAWLVCSASREVIEWFAEQPSPSFALFGGRRGVKIAGAGPDKIPALEAATQRLIKLGHRRIVMMTRPTGRLPEPGLFERTFLDGLKAHGIVTGDFNLPFWEESVEGFHRRMETLFDVTPPTALIVDEVPLFHAAQQFLATRGLRVPADVSLICTDNDPGFIWSKPSIAHIQWDIRQVVKHIVRWADNVSCGKPDLRQTMTPAKFVEGGTIGPAKAR